MENSFFVKYDLKLSKEQELQVFAFCVVTVNDKHMEARFKRKCRVKYKDDIRADLCLKVWFESDWYFCNITESGLFWKQLSKNKASNNNFLKLWSSRTEMFLKQVFLKFLNWKTPVSEFLFNKLKKRLQHRCFPVNIAKVWRTTFL